MNQRRLTIVVLFSLLCIWLGACGQSGSGEAREGPGDAPLESGEVTLEGFDRLSDDDRLNLLNCQITKYKHKHGNDATFYYMREKASATKRIPGNPDDTSVQERMIYDGLSCTHAEMDALGDDYVRLRPPASSAASASASASAN